MSKEPLDLEAMADEIARRFCASLSGKRIILSALREVTEQSRFAGMMLTKNQIDEQQKALAQKDKEIERLAAKAAGELNDVCNLVRKQQAELTRLTELVEKLRNGLVDYGDHAFSCQLVRYDRHDLKRPMNPKCTCGLEQLLNEATKKEV